MFQDRLKAGKMLAAKLRKYQNDPGVVLAVPRGGVPVAYSVAKELGFPLELILTKKIGHPANKEYAIGAASLTDFFVNSHEGVSNEYIDKEIGRIRNRLQEMQQEFMGDARPAELKGKTVIVIDDGIATGNTLLATINILRKREPAKIIIAVPVASKSSVQLLAAYVDELIAVHIPDEFYGVGAFYDDFKQLTDDDVKYFLDKLKEFQNVS